MNLLSEIIGGISTAYTIFDSINSKSSSSPTSSVNDIKYPTDYNLKKLTLSSSAIGELDLKPYMVELNYFEDIYSNFVSGKLVLSDSVGVIFRSGMNGTESLNMEFVRAAGGSSLKQTFRIFSISDRHHDISNNFENFTINFCSEELLISEKYRISKSYKNKMVSDIVSDILKNTLKTQKTIDIESTTGNYDFILPNKKIFETINWLSYYAIPSGTKKGADMLLYENSKGFHYKSLQSLYKQKSIFNFEYNPKNVTLETQPNFFYTETHNIMKIEVMNNFNTLDATTKGTFNNRLITIDPLTRKTHTTDFVYDDYFKSSNKLNKNDVATNNNNRVYKDRFGKSLYDSPDKDKEAGALQLSVTNANQYKTPYINQQVGSVNRDFFIEQSFTHRNSQLRLSSYIRVKIVVAGNSDIIVGTVVNLKIFETKEILKNTKKVDDTYLSGNYLVTAVRHIINPIRYTTIIELAKESNI